MSNNNGQLTKRVWAAIVIFMLVGSVAANIESIYLSIFLNNTVYKDGAMGSSITLTDAVNLIVSLSAVVAAIAAFIMGTLSEKMKNRKIFISFGYIAWGIVAMLFGVVKTENVSKFFGLDDSAKVITITAVTVIAFSLILAFLRSTSNDSVFNAWVTDVTTPETTAIVETILTVMGFVATGIITVLASRAQSGKTGYGTIFVILGIAAIVSGLLGLVLIQNPKKFENANKDEENSSYVSDLFYGFRPNVIKENSNLYLMLMSGCLFNSAFQVFFPYLFIYLGSVVVPANKDVDLLSPVFILCLIITIEAVIVGIILLMKVYAKNKAASFIPGVAFFVIGLFILSSTTEIVGIIIGLAPALVGYAVIMIQFGATVRDNIPQDKVGLFQGIRMIFLVLIPMLVGPTLGNIAAKNSDITFTTDIGAVKVLPTEDMFLYAAIVAALIFIPMLAFLKKDFKKIPKAKRKPLIK